MTLFRCLFASQNHKAIANFLPGLQKIFSYCFIRLRKRLKKGIQKDLF